MPRNFRIIFDVALCALILLLAWQNLQLRSKIAGLHASIAGARDKVEEAAGTPVLDQKQLELNESDKRELMRLRAEVTQLKQDAVKVPKSSPPVANSSPATSPTSAEVLTPDQWTNVGNSTPKEALQTLLWHLKSVADGADVLELIKHSPGVIMYQSSLELNEIPNLHSSLPGLLLNDVASIQSVELDRQTRKGSTEAPNDQIEVSNPWPSSLLRPGAVIERESRFD